MARYSPLTFVAISAELDFLTSTRFHILCFYNQNSLPSDMNLLPQN